MHPTLEKIIKLLTLEIERNYDNRAVLGGLDKYIPNWKSEAAKYNLSSEIIDYVTTKLSNYPLANIDNRKKTIEELLSYFNKYSNENLSADDKNEEKFFIDEEILNNSIKFSELDKDIHENVKANQENQKNDTFYDLNIPITNINGIGKKNSNLYKKLNINSVNELFYYFPYRYEDFSKLNPINRLRYNDECSIAGSIANITTRRLKNNKKSIVEVVLDDGSGSLRVIWFNKPYLINQLNKNDQIIISGKIDMYLGRLVVYNPEWEPIDKEHLNTNRILPVYSLTAGLSQRQIRKTIYQAVELWIDQISDHIPEHIKNKAGVIDLNNAIHDIHFPDTQSSIQKAKERLAFDELFLLQLNVLHQKSKYQSSFSKKIIVDNEELNRIFQTLPYKLTESQNKVLREFITDLKSGKPMNRLLQGDVGSGKTIVSIIICYLIAKNGGQVSIMAPTGILAEQHFQNFSKYINDFIANSIDREPLYIEFLTGDTTEHKKQRVLQDLSNGRINIIIGTHSLLEDNVKFNNLQLSIIDEQHRFGIIQRAKLREKGQNQHLLVMTATPIPRSLALTIYGDLDISIIDCIPPGRIPVDTHILSPNERERAYQLIRSQIEQNKQAFIVYPYVENDNGDEIKAAIQEREKLANDIFPSYSIGLLHGRMRPSEKELVMKDFKNGKYSILAATSVVEVGIDIPEATIILIEGANRFGLAQLHQFRGRVGRGQHKSYCLLIPEKEDQINNQRLLSMEQTNNGFELAELDLNQRGPGDFIGLRQSGFSSLIMAKYSDIKTIEKARKYAHDVYDSDPELKKEEHNILKLMVEKTINYQKGDIS